MDAVVNLSTQVVTQEEFAAMLHVTRGTIYNLRKNKTSNFPPPINTGLKKLLWRRPDAEAYLRYGKAWNLA